MTGKDQVPWLSLTPAGGILATFASKTVTFSINPAALGSGSQNGTGLFTKTTRFSTYSRLINFIDGTGVNYFSELVSSANDTDNQSRGFTPIGSSNFYDVPKTA